jgi:hypothetical protein
VGGFAFPAESHDAALLRNLVPGGYTMRVAPGSSNGGITLLELFDASTSGTKALAHFSSVAVRAGLAGGERALVGGFTVTGEGSIRMLVRAVGPGLKQRGISSGATDPRLSIFRSGSNTPIASNDNWAVQPTGTDLTRLFAALGASALVPNSKDAALVVTLEPGNYTFRADAADGADGLALLEFYLIDL